MDNAAGLTNLGCKGREAAIPKLQSSRRGQSGVYSKQQRPSSQWPQIKQMRLGEDLGLSGSVCASYGDYMGERKAVFGADGSDKAAQGMTECVPTLNKYVCHVGFKRQLEGPYLL